MRVALRCHPDTPSSAISGIEAEVSREGPGILALRYFVHGEMANILLPFAADPVRADNLWAHACFEAFLGAGSGYIELNFAPSRAWAAYRFDGYRSGMSAAAIAPPRIDARSDARRLELSATVDVDAMSGRLGLSAVIEEKDGRRSFWALAHPPGDPDFHHETCFALELPAAEAP